MPRLLSIAGEREHSTNDANDANEKNDTIDTKGTNVHK